MGGRLRAASSRPPWRAGWFSSPPRSAWPRYLVGHGGFHAVGAERMAAFSVGEAAWFVGFLILSAGALAAILSGAWSGLRAKTAWIFLGAILILDLGRADLPWIHYFDYESKYSPNDVTDFLTQTKAL